MPYRKEVRRAIGRRGLLLMLFGVFWMLFGIQTTQNPRPRFSNGQDSANIVLAFMDHPWWGWFWVAAGAGAAVAGFFRNRRPFFGSDYVGYQLIVLPSIVWTLFYLWSWIAHLSTGGAFGRASSSFGLTLWCLITAIILTISGWPEELVHTDEEETRRRYRHRARKVRRSTDG